jgi:3-phosphoshikimate 1-carboxyvinyltransferase
VEDTGKAVQITVNEPLRINDDVFFVRESGTLLRFLLPLVSLLPGPDQVNVEGTDTLEKRSNRESVGSLREAGLEVDGTGEEETVPVTLYPGQVIDQQSIPVAAGTTSQLLSGWLITLSAIGGGTLKRTTDLVSAPYVTMTEQVLNEAGVDIEHSGDDVYQVRPGSRPDFDYSVPGDFSSAAFLIVAGCLSDATLTLRGLNPEDPQADRRIISILQELGAELHWKETAPGLRPTLVSKGDFRPEGFEIDASDCPDLVPVLAVLGAISEGESLLKNLSHLKNKESDRLERTAQELRKAGYEVTTTTDSLRINGEFDGSNAVALDAHEDHRLAMAFSVLGLIRGGVKVTGADCVTKSYPNFFNDLETLGITFQRIN